MVRDPQTQTQPSCCFHWVGGLDNSSRSLTWDKCPKEFQEVFVVPFPLGYDAALMTVYDAPHSSLVAGRAGLLADIFRHEPKDRAA